MTPTNQVASRFGARYRTIASSESIECSSRRTALHANRTMVVFMTIEDIGGRRTVTADELLLLVGDHLLIEEGVATGFIESAGQVAENVAITVTDGVDGTTTTERVFLPDAEVTIEPADRGRAPVTM